MEVPRQVRGLPVRRASRFLNTEWLELVQLAGLLWWDEAVAAWSRVPSSVSAAAHRPRCLPQPLVGRRPGHSPLVLHNEPNGVADIPVLLVGAELHLHPHVLLLSLNVLERVLHQVTHSPVLPGV